MPTVAFYSFGCRTNKEEIDTTASQFRRSSFDIVYDEKNFVKADFIVVNTCSVTQTAENKNLKFLRSIKNKYPQAKIVATGCLIQQNSDLDFVDFLIGNARKNDIFDILKNESGGVFVENLQPDGVLSLSKFIENPQNSDRTRLSIKIEEGCNSFCSYCIVPYLRGAPRSADFDEIISLAKHAISLEYKEIVLTGTHIGQYNFGGKSFLDVIKAIVSLDGDVRLRLSSMNPSDCDEKLFELMIKNPQICRHLHVSVQSLSAGVVKAMNRSVDALNAFYETLQKYRKFLPTLNLGGDFIVGFPTESDEDFSETCKSIEKFGFNYGHVFAYSSRPGTSAAEMINKIDEKTKKQRSQILKQIIAAEKEKFALSLIGKIEEVINEKNGELNAITSNFLRVRGDKNINLQKNQKLDVVLTAYNCEDGSFIGRVL